jgi:hypothetical protein
MLPDGEDAVWSTGVEAELIARDWYSLYLYCE